MLQDILNANAILLEEAFFAILGVSHPQTTRFTFECTRTETWLVDGFDETVIQLIVGVTGLDEIAIYAVYMLCPCVTLSFGD